MGFEEHPPQDLSPEEWELVKDLVYECQLMSEADRIPFLDKQAPIASVRAEVERLLNASAQSGGFLARPALEELFGTHNISPQNIGRYRVTGVIGSGGMGIVYAAVDDNLGRHVALKALHPHLAANPDFRRRLFREARILSGLNHPNIVTVYDSGSDSGIDYIAMEYISGSTLGDVIRIQRLTESEVLGYALQIAAGLSAAHQAGVVHRDLKPSNVLVNDTGLLKLVDFGLGKQLDTHWPESPETIEGRFAGTAAYMSPEQAEGRTIDARSDIFSFGSLLYEMATATKAFAGETVISTIANVLNADPIEAAQLAPEIHPALADVIHRCLKKHPDRRFQSMADVRVHLENAREELNGGTESANKASRRTGATFPKWAVAAGACLVAAVAAITGYFNGKGATPARYTNTRITSDKGFASTPALSRDGKLIAYASDRAGHGDLDIWIQYVSGGEPLRLTNHEADDHQPAFSPDGRVVFFRSERNGGGLYSVSSLGGPGRLVALKGRNPSVSPTGDWVAYWLGEAGGGFLAGASRVYITSTSGGESFQFRPDFESAAFPVWAPDGQRILFLGRKSSANGPVIDWWLASVKGTDAVPTGALKSLRENELTSVPGLFRIVPSIWLGGSGVVLFSAHSGDATNVWALPIDSAGLIRKSLVQWTSGAAQELEPTAAETANGVLVGFSSQVRETAIWRVPLNPLTGLPAGPPQRLIANQPGLSSPSITSNGNAVVFSSLAANGHKITLRDLNNDTEKVVSVVRSSQSIRPIVSGDGRYVAYRANRVGYRIATENGVPERLCDSCGFPTHLSRDGDAVLFEKDPEANMIQQAAPNSQPLTLLKPLTATTLLFGARYSPDQRWIVFSAVRSGSTYKHLFIAHSMEPESSWIRISEEGSKDSEPWWSPDGRRIYFLSEKDGFRCVWMRSVDMGSGIRVGPITPIAHHHNSSRVIRGNTPYSGEIGLSVSIRDIVYTAVETSAEVWVSSRRAESGK